jgi:O-antigen/teichoic acid export membrane protein
VVLLCLSAWHSIVLLASGHQRVTMLYNLAALVVGVLLHAALIPSLGPSGAAMGTVGVGGFTVACGVVMAHRLLDVSVDAGRLARVLTAGAALAAATALVGVATSSPLAGMAVGLVLYPVALGVLGVLPSSLLDLARRRGTQPVVRAEV